VHVQLPVIVCAELDEMVAEEKVVVAVVPPEEVAAKVQAAKDLVGKRRPTAKSKIMADSLPHLLAVNLREKAATELINDELPDTLAHG